MRRRPRPDQSTAPAHLRTFRPRDWTGSTLDRIDQWAEARRAWWLDHPDAWPHALAVVREHARVRDRLAGRP